MFIDDIIPISLLVKFNLLISFVFFQFHFVNFFFQCLSILNLWNLSMHLYLERFEECDNWKTFNPK